MSSKPSNAPNDPSQRVAKQVKEDLVKVRGSRRGQVSGSAFRSAAHLAAQRTRTASRGAGNLARETVEGAVLAASEVGGETGALVRDTVIGVVEGTAQVVTVTTPAVREVVVGAIRGSNKVEAEIDAAGRDAVEGAIVGAASVGIDSKEAASAAVEGAVEAVLEAGGDLNDAAKVTVGGVVSGVTTAEGDVTAATRDAAGILISSAADDDQDIDQIVDVAGSAVDAAIEQAGDPTVEAEKVIEAAATGAVEAAYEMGQSHGDRVRRSVVTRIKETRADATPHLKEQLSEIADRLADDLPRGRGAWRAAALIEAGRHLFRTGGIDLSASLAYFTVLSFLPLVALAIIVAALFGGPDRVGEELTEILVYYFPTSADLMREAVDGLISNSVGISLLSLVGIVFGANGLFMAVQRALRRIFEEESRKLVQITAVQVLVTTLIVILFLLSVGLSAFIQVFLSFVEGNIGLSGSLSTVAGFAVGTVTAVMHVLIAATVFAVVYYHLPSSRVEWRDATFGALVAIVLFETSKHLFLLYSDLFAQRSAVYGSIASFIVLLMWAYISGLIFLYGAAVTRMSADQRTKSPGRVAS